MTASAAHSDAAHPPISVAVTTIGAIAVAMVGSTISSQLVDLDIADIGAGFSVSADDASWISCVATMTEVVSISITAIPVRALSLRRVAVYSASLYVVCACLSLLVSGEDRLIVLPPYKAAFIFWGEGLYVFPLMLLYTAISYTVFRGKVRPMADHY